MGKSNYDYCINPEELKSYGWGPSKNLHLCEGDCDNDSKCVPGLKCFQRDALEAIPGCSGSETYSMDYCTTDEFTGTAQVGENLSDVTARLGEYTFDKMWNAAAAYTNGNYILFYCGSIEGWQWVRGYNQ